MPQHWPWIPALFTVVALVGPSSARGQQAGEPMEAFRRRARAEAARREKLFDALREIGAAQPVIERQVVVVPRPQGVITFEEPNEDEEAPAGEASAPGRDVLARENLDRMIFGETDDEAARHRRLETMLAEKVRRAAGYNRLTAAQQGRLRLAGQGDVKRFFDRVAEKRAEFELARRDLRSGVLLLRGLYPEQSDDQNGPFGPGSLYDKMLNKILGEDPDRRLPIPTILDR